MAVSESKARTCASTSAGKNPLTPQTTCKPDQYPVPIIADQQISEREQQLAMVPPNKPSQTVSTSKRPPARKRQTPQNQPAIQAPKQGTNSTVFQYASTELGNAERFADQHKGHIIYVHDGGGWHAWDGCRWKRDNSGEAMRSAIKTVRQIYVEVATIPVTTEVKELVNWAKKSESKQRLKSMLELAQSLSGISATFDQFDTNPWLFNVENGTIDLHTGDLLPHNPDDRITKLAPVRYEPDAKCPTWEKFLNRVIPDEETRIFVQRAVGYTLTGTTEEQCIFFLYGVGQNGKSKFTGALEGLLGEFWDKTSAETLMHRDHNGGIRNDVAKLRGLRLCTVSEVGEGQNLHEAFIKDVSGGDALTGRFLYGEHFTFQPTCKIFMYGNHKPVIRGSDEGIWRRIRLIPFLVKIPDEERDLNLAEKLRNERPGILQWAIQGCLDWQLHGLPIPQQITQATQEYRQEMDNVEQFLLERSTKTPDESGACTVKSGSLYEAYSTWCHTAGAPIISLPLFSKRLEAKGCTKKRSNSGWHYQGLRLITDDEVPKQSENR